MGLYKTFCSYNILFNQYRNVSYKGIKSWYASLVKPRPQDPPYSHIIQIGDPALRVVSDSIPVNLIATPEIKYLIKCMKNVIGKYEGVGIAAPQIGIPLRVLMVQFDKKHASRYSQEEQKIKEMDLMPLTVVVNPEVKVTNSTIIKFPEGCLSVKGYFAEVPRYRSVEVNGYDENGESVKFSATGWLARIVQHEMDHLNGKMYTDIMDRNSFSCSCWKVVNERNGKVELPFGPD